MEERERQEQLRLLNKKLNPTVESWTNDCYEEMYEKKRTISAPWASTSDVILLDDDADDGLVQIPSRLQRIENIQESRPNAQVETEKKKDKKDKKDKKNRQSKHSQVEELPEYIKHTNEVVTNSESENESDSNDHDL
eukprot:TRINITY_DN11605_c0_g1_i3.p1 TRINITY_DN11605_c0_g1~~TRINITY_DN11605_c0_g1_i3.p1  ORF type:complete len:161 (-),score=35.10 TRINITY_DN11605_c0_g1_i3:55-465(-)